MFFNIVLPWGIRLTDLDHVKPGSLLVYDCSIPDEKFYLIVLAPVKIPNLKTVSMKVLNSKLMVVNTSFNIITSL